MPSQIIIKRLRVMKGTDVAYDELFHRGVNIIHGENSSGKSTIVDFIFYVLGGEFDRWKGAASLCTSARIEIETPQSTLTLHRSIAGKLEPIFAWFGNLEASLSVGFDDWQRLPIHRPSGGKELSISQVLFRAAGIPEAPNAGSSNITMHQIMRLLYSDQQTPAGKLFRFESFDTRDIREAVGALVIGNNGYDLYADQLEARVLKSEYADKNRLYNAAVAGLPSLEGLGSVSQLDGRLADLARSRDTILRQISEVDTLIVRELVEVFIADRKKMQIKLRSKAVELNEGEKGVLDLKDDIQEIEDFLEHLQEQMETLRSTEDVAEALGTIEFQYCPACLKKVHDARAGHCIVCDQVIDEDAQRSKYFEIKLDVELQVRETTQLLKTKRLQADELQVTLRGLRREFSTLQTEFSARYDVSNSPRETFLAEKNKQLGSIDREIVYLDELRTMLERIDRLSAERTALNDQISAVDARITRLIVAASRRRTKALDSVSAIGRRLLKDDLPREETFEKAKSFSVDFGDDAMLVDGKMNFAESSNVILKNTAILSLFLAACYDREFWHPRLLLMDNVEDKGMEVPRSWNFQRLIVRESQSTKALHQIIFTTSSLAPELETGEFTVGDKYTRQNKTLRGIEEVTLDAE